jgi:hypothetical protein
MHSMRHLIRWHRDPFDNIDAVGSIITGKAFASAARAALFPKTQALAHGLRRCVRSAEAAAFDIDNGSAAAELKSVACQLSRP